MPGGVDQDAPARPSTSSSVSIASRVVPASSETITRSAPRKALTQRRLADVRAADHREPRPRSVARRLRPLGARRRAASSAQPVEQVAGAAAVGGRDARPARRARARRARRPAARRRRRRPCWRRRPPARSARRRISATSASPGAGPARASTTSATTSASAIASRAWCLDRARERVARPRGRRRRCRSARSAAPFHSHSSALRSRVTPASLVDDRLAAAGEAVDQRRLADVGKADDGDPRQAAGGHRASQPALARQLDHARDDLVDARARWCRARPRRRPARRAPCSRSRSRASRSRLRGEHRPRRARRSRRRGAAPARRRWRSRKTFSGASGLTTVPMSRPSAT